jgi:hypothetical protein
MKAMIFRLAFAGAVSVVLFAGELLAADEDEIQKVGVAAVTASLVDPDSAKFDSVWVVKRDPSSPQTPNDVKKRVGNLPYFCVRGKVNAKNRMAGYSGAQLLVSVVVKKNDKWRSIAADVGNEDARMTNAIFDCGFFVFPNQ